MTISALHGSGVGELFPMIDSAYGAAMQELPTPLLTGLLERVASGRRVVGFDVVELCPAPGQWASEFLAAKLVYRFLSLILADHQPSR